MLFMKRITLLTSITLILALLLSGCGGPVRPEQTAEETINTAFTALRDLDMVTFNACTNNKKGTGYFLFSQLSKKQNDSSYKKVAQTLVKNLTWEINSIEENGETAVAKVTIHNKDFSDAAGIYIANLIQKVNQKQGGDMNLTKLIRTTVSEAKNDTDGLVACLESCQKDFSTNATVTLQYIDNNWQIVLDETLCNTLTGHIGTDNFSEDIEKKITAAEELLNNNLERWGVDVKSEEWTDLAKEKLQLLLTQK